jgi:hypothetical protein
MSNYTSIEAFNTALTNTKVMLPAMMMPMVKDAQNVMAREIRARVSVMGETNTGGTFSAYSAKHKAKKLKYGSSALGKKIDNKNFYFSGKMWQSFGVSRISLQGQRIVSNIGFLGQSGYVPAADLNEWHSERENQGIAYPNKEEELLLVAEIENVLFKALDQLL